MNLTPSPIFIEDDPTRTQERWELRLAKFPPLFLGTEEERFPAKALAAFQEELKGAAMKDPRREKAMGWIIAGEVGTAKTRLAVLIALARAAATWGWPGYLSAAQLRSKAFSDWAAADKIIEAAQKPDILVLDDLGKGAPGATIDETIFAILDARTSWKKPTIITTQYTPETLKGRFKEAHTADAIMRRIQQFSTPIIL
jgi:DNA replication protein DnaC